MPKFRLAVLFVCAAALAVGTASAQDKPAQQPPAMSAEQQAMMAAFEKAMTPGPEHKMLEAMAGEWTYTSKMWMDPAAPPMESSGTSSFKSILGGRYVQHKHHGTAMGMPFEGMGINGYDNLKKKFVSTWIDNMSTMIMYMSGTFDPASKTFTYTGDVDDVMTGKPVKVRETLHAPDADSAVMEWYEMRGGKEVRTMEITYKRKK